MKEHKLLEAVGYIDEKYVNNAKKVRAQRSGRSYIKWIAAAAACLVLVATVGVLATRLYDNGQESGKTPSGIAKDTSQNENAQSGITSSGITSNAEKPVENKTGIYIPAEKLPDPVEMMTADMEALVVYNGGVYLQAEGYWGEDAEKLKPIIGEYIGTASGNIDEWSSGDEYNKELASSIEGDVYTVKGYGSDFRICVVNEDIDENENPVLWIQFLDRLNDITLTKGADLFEDRLFLRERTKEFKWLSHHDFNDLDGDVHNIQDAVIDKALWADFLDKLDEGEFADLRNSAAAPGGRTIYDNPHQAHVFVQMTDGTVVRLRLLEGGYVGYNPLGWYFVKVPEEVFEPIYTACGGE